MRKFLNLSFALALVAGLFAGSLATAGAISPSYGPQNPGQNWLYFPFVHNGTALGSGTFTGSVVIQNLEIFPIAVSVGPAGGGASQQAVLNPRASKTWTASALGVANGGGGAWASAVWTSGAINNMLDLGMCPDTGNTYTETVTKGDPNTSDQLQHSPIELGSVSIAGYTSGTDYKVNYAAGQINWSPAGNEPATGDQYVVTYSTADCGTPSIGGVEKHEATTGAGPVVTTAAETTVDGSNAVPLCDLAYASNQAISPCVAPNFTGTSLPELSMNFQFRWILPIVQDNNGWDSMIHVTNVSGLPNVGVNLYFYQAAGQGVAGPSTILWSGTLGKGATQSVDLATVLMANGITGDTVGSVWIDADAGVVASVDRFKDATTMALTNVAQPRMDNVVNYLHIFGINPTDKYAPLVFRDYNNWNTGINIANLSSNSNQVTITYYNYSDNSSSQETVNIPPRAMEYVYRPGSGTDAGLSVGAISAATISGTDPIAVAVDEVKYVGGAGAGQAMSYPATEGAMAGNAYDTGQFPALANLSGTGRVVFKHDLSLPLAQKGNVSTGLGDFSGINLFNGDANSGIEAWVIFEDNSGLPVAPTTGANEREMPIKLSMPALGSATVYTANYSEMPDGFTGSAVVGSMYTTVGQSTAKALIGPLVAVSNNVNYAVDGDGSSVFNLYPYSHLLPQLAAGCYYPGFIGGGICIP